MRVLFIAGTTALCALLSGCTSLIAGSLSGRGFDAAPVALDFNKPNKTTLLSLLNAALGTQGVPAEQKSLYEALVAFDSLPDNEDKIRKRNAILDTMMLSSENSCATYVLDLRGYRITLNSTAGIIDSLVNAAGTAATDTSTGRALAGISTFVSSGVGSVTKNAWGDMAAELIASKIIEGRNIKRKELVEDRTRSAVGANYKLLTLAHGLSDITRYHGMCSARYGVTELQKAAASVPPPSPPPPPPPPPPASGS